MGRARGVALYLAALLGAGLLVMPSLTYQAAGPAALLAWAGLLALSVPVALTFAEPRRPVAGRGRVECGGGTGIRPPGRGLVRVLVRAGAAGGGAGRGAGRRWLHRRGGGALDEGRRSLRARPSRCGAGVRVRRRARRRIDPARADRGAGCGASRGVARRRPRGVRGPPEAVRAERSRRRHDRDGDSVLLLRGMGGGRAARAGVRGPWTRRPRRHPGHPRAGRGDIPAARARLDPGAGPVRSTTGRRLCSSCSRCGSGLGRLR